MSSQKTAPVPGIQLQIGTDLGPAPQFITDSDGHRTPLLVSTTAAYVDGNGKLGIATIPEYPLHVGKDKTVRFELGTTAAFSIGGNGDVAVDAEGIPKGRFVVTNAGKVGINQPNPQAQLDVNGQIRATSLAFTGELAVPGMKPETSAPVGAKLEAVYIDRATGTLYFHNHP